MEKVPNMISTKDLSYITDMFNWHIIAAEKYEAYLNQIEDKECSKKLDYLFEMHLQICSNLLSILESGEN